MEILYKAKTIVSKEWVYGYLVNHLTIRAYKDHEEAEFNGDFEEHIIDSETVCRYIGREDNNGNKVFTGDKFISNDGFECVIYFCDKNLSFMVGKSYVTVDGVKYESTYNLTEYDLKNIQITGNIHDKID